MEETVSFPSEDVSWSSCRGAAEMNPTRNHEVASSIPGLAQWVKGSGVAVSCGVGCRCSSGSGFAVTLAEAGGNSSN